MRTPRHLLMLAAGCGLLAACGCSDGAPSGKTGSVSAHLVFPGLARPAHVEPLALDTSPLHTVRLSAVKGTSIYAAQDFLFSAGSGTLDNIPVGTDYEIQILGLDANGVVLFSRRVQGVAVTGGATTALGEVTMNPAEGLLYFLAASGPASTVRTLWSYDGFSARVFSTMGQGWSLGTDVAAYKGLLYFGAVNTVGATVKSGLWSCDGTNPPSLVKEFTPASDGSLPSGFAVLRSVLYFSAYQASAGQELWKTDGTESGTVQVADIRSGTDGSGPSDLVVFGGRLFFSAATATAGTELFHYGGTGSPAAVDLAPGAASGRPSSLFPSHDGLYFAASSASAGDELWAADGGATVATMVSDIRPGDVGSSPQHFALLGRTLYFSAGTAAAGTELWSCSGWAQGATLAADANAVRGSDPRELAVLGGRLYFSGHAWVAGTNRGNELMVYTPAAGASMAQNINFGNASSSPRNLSVYNRRLFFSAEQLGTGRELCAFNGTSLDDVPELIAGEDGGDPSSLTPFNPEFPPQYDLAGDWFFDEPLASGACGSFGSTNHRVIISQRGSAVVVNSPSFTFNAVLRGENLSWSQDFSSGAGTVSASFSLTVNNLGEHMVGTGTWTRTVSGVPCSVEASVEALKY